MEKTYRNICQIGSPTEDIQLYLEDYARAYIEKEALKVESGFRQLILIGGIEVGADVTRVCVSGAVTVKAIESLGEGALDDEDWQRVYSEIGRYFPRSEVVGWCLVGRVIREDELLELAAVHNENFGYGNRLCMIDDWLSKTEYIYRLLGNELSSLGGYYVYFEKNSEMQMYMASHGDNFEKEEALIPDPQPIVQSRHHKSRKKQYMRGDDRLLRKLVFTAGIMLVLVIVAILQVIVNPREEAVYESSTETVFEQKLNKDSE